MLTKATGKVVALDTDITLAANSDTLIASQKAIKTYVNTVPANATLSNLTDEVAARANLGLGTNVATLQMVDGTLQQTVIADELAPQINQRRKRVAGTGLDPEDVGSGSVLGKIDAQGWLNGAYRFAGRMLWVAHSAVGSVVRAKWKINVTNAAGDDWPAFHFSEQGYLGIGDPVGYEENDPQCSLDVFGMVASNVRGDRHRDGVSLTSGAIDVTGKGFVHLSSAGTLTDIVSSDPFSPEVFITIASGTLTVTHASGKIRCRGGVNQTIVAGQGGLKFKKVPGTSVWDQIG